MLMLMLKEKQILTKHETNFDLDYILSKKKRIFFLMLCFVFMLLYLWNYVYYFLDFLVNNDLNDEILIVDFEIMINV